MTTLFNYDPYYDDFDEDKNFLRVLFRPGYSIQARELTQLQTILSNQIEKFGNHIFKSGSPIIGGKISLDRKANYIILKSQYGSEDIDVTKFADKTIVSFGNNKLVRAKVIATDSSGGSPVLVIKYLSGDKFADNEDIRVYGQEIYASLKETNSIGGSFVASIQEGVYYFKGQFVKVVPQFLVVELFYRTGTSSTINSKPSYKIGLEFDENIIDEIDDVTLLDPAQGSFNYQAPGATRFQVATALTKRTLDSADVSNFFEIIRLVDDVKTKEIDYPIYSEIEKTLARRTYDESGNYTVDPFVISLEEGDEANGKFTAVLDPGKAYVGGYEFQTIAPTSLSINRARDAVSANNYEFITNYESSLVLDNTVGTLDITSYPSLDVHCVPQGNIKNTGVNDYNSTKIGTINASMLRYNDSTSTVLGNTHSYIVNVFNANTTPITGTIPASGSTNTRIVLPTTLAPNVVNAYANMYFAITDGLGQYLSPILITSSNSTTINLSSVLTFIPASNTIQIQSDFKNARSLVQNTGSSLVFSGNVNSDSIESATGFTYINEPKNSSKIFSVPYPAIKDSSLTNMSFYARKYYGGKTSDGAGDIVITAEGTDTFPFSTAGTQVSDSLILENIICIVDSSQAVEEEYGIYPGKPLSLANNNFTVIGTSSTSFTINLVVPSVKVNLFIKSKVNNAHNSSTGAIRGKQLLPLTSGADLHAKVPYEMGGANTLDDANTATNTAFTGGMVFQDIGATNFTTSTILTDLRTPGKVVSLQVPDVMEIVRITDSKSLSSNVTTSMLSSESYDVTDSYEFDNGQRKTHYDHATIKLKRGYPVPTGRVFVQYKYLKHSTAPSPQNDGLFTVDSYLKVNSNMTYDDIYSFNNAEDGKLVSLRSAFDFRPTRAIGSTSLTGAVNPEPLESMIATFDYYLPRIDQIVVKPSREFGIVQGKSAINPLPSNVGEQDMLIYTLYIPAYTETVKDIRVDFKNHRRYTMRDIDNIENRIRQLEYYVSLSTLEKQTASQRILDANGLERSKYGILVDNFTSKDVQASREEVGYDNRNLIENGELKAASLMRTFKLNSNTALSSGATKFNGISTKKVLSLSYTTEEFAKQPYATKSIPIANALFAAFKGTMKLYPEFRGDVDTGRTAKVTLNSTQGLENTFNFVNQAFKYIADNVPQWSNDKNSPFAQVADSKWYQTKLVSSSTSDWTFNEDRWMWQTIRTDNYANVIGAGAQLSQKQISSSSSQVDVGTFVTDLAIQPWMKPGFAFSYYGEGLRPSTKFYHYFDNVSVDAYITHPNKITVNTNTQLIPGEQVIVANTFTQVGTYINLLKTNPNAVPYATVGISETGSANVTINTGYNLSNKVLYGLDSGKSYEVTTVAEHRTGYGYLSGNKLTLCNTDPFFVTIDASSTNNYYNGNTVNIITAAVNSSDWIGESYTISSYTGSTKVATLSGSSTYVGPVYYSICSNTNTNKLGQISGSFFMPPVTFRSGQRNFRLTESFNNTYDADAISFVDKTYTSTGVVTNKTTLVDTVFNVDVNSRIVGQLTSDKLISSFSTQTVTAEWNGDPLAQTFVVDSQKYPNGIFLDNVSLYFRAKDDENLPVRIQIRPTVNGVPSSDFWYPESEITLYPNDITISENPSTTTSTATNFKFNSPIFLKPGLYALVVLTDSPDYVLWSAEKGGKTKNNEFIGNQPYIGTLYKSQNSMEYTPFLNEDLMFILNRCKFNTSSSSIFVFDTEKPTSNTNVDKIRVLTNEIVPAKQDVTNITYSMVSKPYAGTLETTYTSISPQQIYNFGDDARYSVGFRRRVLNNIGDFRLKIEMSTSSDHVSPIVSLENLYINVWENFIDNAEISIDDFTIISGGAGYTNANSIIITSTTGSGAVANTIVDANGTVVGIDLISTGSGYLDDFTISYPDTGNDANVTSNAVIVLNSEFDESRGPCEARYITKPIVLADGFDAGDLRVYLAGNKQGSTEISVYYKILSSSDSTLFKDRSYQKMVCMNPTVVASKTSADYVEYEYRPSSTDEYVTYTSSNGVTYDSFKTFAIKIVLTSNDPSIVPKVKDLRIIALPAG